MAHLSWLSDSAIDPQSPPGPTLSTMREMMSAIRMSVPAAESQLVVKAAAYGAGSGTTGGVCWTCPSRPGHGTTGSPVVSLTSAVGKFTVVCIPPMASLIGATWARRNIAIMMTNGDQA